MQKKKCLLSILSAAALLLGGCGSTQSLEPVEGLEALGAVSVISREEGSGTRSAFAEMVGFDESEDAAKSDATTDDAQIVMDANAVLAAVSEDTSAVGYVSMGALEESDGTGNADGTNAADGVRVLAVDGVAGTLENVKNGKYKLSRPFILAWSGSLSELEQDFLTYVLGKGQEIVGQSHVPVEDSTTFLSGQQEGTISISGSTSAAPLLEALAAEYMEINTHAVVEVTTSDSTTGLNEAMQGTCDFAMASRELKDYEKELLDYEVIAQDGIAVVVNEDNPLDDVSLEELKGLFTGTISEWEMINTERKGDTE